MADNVSSLISTSCDTINSSCSSDGDNIEDNPRLAPDQLIPKIILLSLVSVILVVTNGLLIFTILFHKRLHNKANYFVVALACSDFALGWPTIPIHCMAEAAVFGKGEWTCLLTMCLTTAQVILSVLMLFALSVERYIKLVHPFKYARYISRNKVFITISVCIIYSLLIAFLPLMGWNNFDESKGKKDILICRWEIIMPGSYNIMVMGGHVGPAFLVLPVLHFHIFCTAHHVLRRRTKNNAVNSGKTYHCCDTKPISSPKEDGSSQVTDRDNSSVTQPSPQKSTTKKSRMLFVSLSAFRKHGPDYECSCHTRSYRHFKVLTLAAAYFIVSWFPLVIWELLLCKGGTKEIITAQDYLDPPISVFYYYAAIVLATANSAINPLLFGIGNQTIRTTFLNSLARRKTRSHMTVEASNNSLMLMKQHE